MAFICFLSFRKKHKQESSFQQVGGLLTRTISDFYMWWGTLFFKCMPNSMDFFKIIFLHIIPVSIIVSCLQNSLFEKKSSLIVFLKSMNFVHNWGLSSSYSLGKKSMDFIFARKWKQDFLFSFITIIHCFFSVNYKSITGQNRSF